MKNNSILTFTLLTLFNLTVLSQKPAVLKINEMPNQNNNLPNYLETKNAGIGVSAAILNANWAKLDSLLDPNYTYTGDGFVFSKDEYIGFMQEMRSSFSNFEMILEKSVIDGDLVSIKFISHVVNTGKFMGAPATEQNLEVNGIFMRKVKDGKVLQEWQTTDLLGTMKQIGGGSLFFYSLFVGGFNVKTPPPVRKPNDFLNIDGNAIKFDLMTPKEKNKYIKNYNKTHSK